MTNVDWRANWIWSGEAAPVNAYRIFRRDVAWPADRSSTPTAYISADTHYKLYINGVLVANGPAPSTRLHQTFDAVPVTLDGGETNTIVIIVHHAGVALFSGYRNRGGLLFQMDDIVSDDSWLVAHQSPWDPSSPRLTVQQSHAEYYDARKEPLGMLRGEIDPAQWGRAEIVGPSEGEFWPPLEARDIPMPTLMPYDHNVRIVDIANCTPGEGTTVAARMTRESLRPLSRGQVKRSSESASAMQIIPEDDDISVLYDFGEEVSGFFKVCVEGDNAGAVISIGYDEVLRVGQTPSEMRHSWEQTSSLEYADRCILQDGVTTFRVFGLRAFRYVRLAFRGLKSPLDVHFVTLNESTYPVNRLANFTCSDARLDRIWEIGRRTLQLCMDDRFMDCPWRERAQWVGDARVEGIGAAVCFGDTLLFRRFLRQIAESQYPDGRVDPVGPGEWDDHRPGWPILGFTCIWIASVWDYYQFSADGDLPELLLPSILRALSFMQKYETLPGGLLADVGEWNFTDWAPGLGGMPEGIAGPLNLFYVNALRSASRIAAMSREDAIAIDLSERAEALAVEFAEVFWSSSRGVFVDLLLNGQQGAQASQHTNSLAILYDIGNELQRGSAVAHLMTDPSLVAVKSPYFSYYLLSALYKSGRHTEALAFIHEKWGFMVDHGATTWWETFGVDTSSHCHAWSIGPSIDLLTEYVGIKCAEPGYALVICAPKPSGLTWAKGIVPIPEGDVICSWRENSDRFVLDISVPVGIHIQTILPAAPGDMLIVNGEPVTEDMITRRGTTEAELCVMPGSGYRFEVVKELR